MVQKHWEHFCHQADIGVRGVGASKEEAFEQAALALTTVVTDVNSLEPKELVKVDCGAPSDELIFVDWLNAIVYRDGYPEDSFARELVGATGRRGQAPACC